MKILNWKVLGLSLVMMGCQHSSSQRDFEKQKFQVQTSKTLSRFVLQAARIQNSAAPQSIRGGASVDGGSTPSADASVRNLHGSGTGFTLHSSIESQAQYCVDQNRAISQTPENYARAMLSLATCLNRDLNRSAVMPYAYANLDPRSQAYYMYLNSQAVPYSDFSSRPDYQGQFSNYMGTGGWPTEDLYFGQ